MRHYRLYYLGIKLVFNILSSISHKRLPPMIAAGALIEGGNGRILLLDRSDGLGFSLPGGLLHWDETADQAAEREGKEETGYDVQVANLVGVYGGPNVDPRFNCVVIVYAAKVIGGTLKPSDEGQPVWISRAELPDELAFNLEPALTDYFSQEAGSATPPTYTVHSNNYLLRNAA